MGSLVIKVLPGASFMVGDRKVTVVRMQGALRFVVEVEGPMNQQYEISAVGRVEVLPRVFLSAAPNDKEYVAKVRIEAPKEIRIERIGFDRYEDSA